MTTPRDHLARLVHDRRAHLGLSYEQLAKAAAEHGDPEMNPAWLSRLKHGRLKNPPTQERLEALAAALGLPAQRLVEANVAQFYGYLTIWSRDRKARTLVPVEYEEWPPEEQAKVDRLLNERDMDGM
jgi:transcriptional regulator with XRE-family HTH domain